MTRSLYDNNSWLSDYTGHTRSSTSEVHVGVQTTGGKAQVKRQRGFRTGLAWPAGVGGSVMAHPQRTPGIGSQSNVSCPDWMLESCPPVSGPGPVLSEPLGGRTLDPHGLSWHKAQY